MEYKNGRIEIGGLSGAAARTGGLRKQGKIKYRNRNIEV